MSPPSSPQLSSAFLGSNKSLKPPKPPKPPSVPVSPPKLPSVPSPLISPHIWSTISWIWLADSRVRHLGYTDYQLVALSRALRYSDNFSTLRLKLHSVVGAQCVRKIRVEVMWLLLLFLLLPSPDDVRGKIFYYSCLYEKTNFCSANAKKSVSLK